MIRFPFAIIAIGLIALSADAQCRTIVRSTYVAPTYQAHAAYQHHNYAPVVAAFYTPIPVYSVGYADQSLQIEFEKLKTQVEQFKVQQLQRELNLRPNVQPTIPGVQPVQPEFSPAPKKVSTTTKAHPALALLTKNCQSCHSETPKANKFVMFAKDTLVPMTDRQLARVVSEVFSGRMPKGGSMKDDEVGVVMDWFDSVSGK